MGVGQDISGGLSLLHSYVRVAFPRNLCVRPPQPTARGPGSHAPQRPASAHLWRDVRQFRASGPADRRLHLRRGRRARDTVDFGIAGGSRSRNARFPKRWSGPAFSCFRSSTPLFSRRPSSASTSSLAGFSWDNSWRGWAGGWHDGPPAGAPNAHSPTSWKRRRRAWRATYWTCRRGRCARAIRPRDLLAIARGYSVPGRSCPAEGGQLPCRADAARSPAPGTSRDVAGAPSRGADRAVRHDPWALVEGRHAGPARGDRQRRRHRLHPPRHLDPGSDARAGRSVWSTGLARRLWRG